MKYRHAMPFGCEILADGSAFFRVWAPSAESVSLVFNGADLPMVPAAGGWFEIDEPSARPGSRYQYRIAGGVAVPDPASRFNPDDVHGASEVVDPTAFDWQDGDWRGRPWEEAVIYELHVGTFTAAGTFAAAAERLPYLADLGVTAVELMPVADFSGGRNWGYDGVLLFAPDSRYGRPEDLKAFIQRAHGLGLMVFMDVVYNHFGPDGNYLHAYAAPFFTDRHRTPWGAAINFSGRHGRTVRDFYIHNALYWLEEYHLDGLRLDAVHAIKDEASPHIVEEIAEAIRRGPGRDRPIHLILENDLNQARFLAPAGGATAQWNDDIHHAFHVLLTGEKDGYYAGYADRPIAHLGRCLTEGFAYQGEPSPYHEGKPRGEPSAHLPPTAFISFLQNHDQVGNRAFGERIGQLAEPRALAAAVAVWLLAPAPPMLFMGEEFAAPQPFLYFCHFGGDLAKAVTEGRREEFARFSRFSDPEVRARIPDPNAEATFRASVLNWNCLDQPPHSRWLALYRHLLALRRQHIAPRLPGMAGGQSRFQAVGTTGLAVTWRLGDGSTLGLMANLGFDPGEGFGRPAGAPIYRSDQLGDDDLAAGRLPPWAVAWFLDTGKAGKA